MKTVERPARETCTPSQTLDRLKLIHQDLRMHRDLLIGPPSTAPRVLHGVRGLLKRVEGGIRHAERMQRVENGEEEG